MFAAAAFHWIDPEASWEKVARVLVPGGTLGLIQYCGLAERDGIDDQRPLRSALARVAPEIAAEWPAYRNLAAIGAGVKQRRDNVSEVWAWIGSYDLARARVGRLFVDVQVASVPIVVEHTADELNGLLRTMSFYSRLSPGQRRAMENELVAMYERLGRPIRSSTGGPRHGEAQRVARRSAAAGRAPEESVQFDAACLANCVPVYLLLCRFLDGWASHWFWAWCWASQGL